MALTFEERRALIKRKQELRRELHSVEVALCPGHVFETWVYWDGHGRLCKHCGLKITDVCHHVGCNCGLPHSTDKR